MDAGKSIPFFENHDDDAHCLQASLKMILKYYLPDRDFSWDELNKMTAKAPGSDKATWSQQMVLSLAEMGFDVLLVENFDAERFAKEGYDYLVEAYGKESADWQAQHSDLAQEQRIYQQLLEHHDIYERRVPTLEDVKTYLAEGYLVQATVNARKLNDEEGYFGHSVVIFDIDDEHVVLNDPGHPGRERRVETRQHFETAWASPSPDVKKLIAIKYKEPL